MEHSATMSLSHQKLADKADIACCLGSAHGQCSTCSQCETEVAFGGFTSTDFHTESEHTKHLSHPPKMASLPDGHRCKKFPCPVCNPGRSQRGVLSSAAAVVTPRMVEVYAQGAVQQLLLQGRQQTGVVLFGDGGHVCRRFPCPVCGNGQGRFARALEVEVGCT